jgi:hypothetical protein
MTALRIPILLLILLILLAGCKSRQESSTTGTAPSPAAEPGAPSATETGAGEEPAPPAPPVVETFDGEPQLSLFPRVAEFRPEDEKSQEQGVWAAFIDHVLRTSGVVPRGGEEEGNAWSVRGIKGLESVGFFAPLGVEPQQSYKLSFSYRGELPEGGSAGIGILEFDRFLWIGEQFTEAMLREHQTGQQSGVKLHGNSDWTEQTFTFTTSPNSRMIHLVLFRDGTADRQPVFFDNIAVEPVGLPAATKTK